MVVANKDSDPFQTPTAPNYTTFQVDASGIPTMNPGSTLTLPVGTSPTQILKPRKMRREILAIQFLGVNVSSYHLTKSGIMTSTGSLDLAGSPVGGVLHPSLPNLYLPIGSNDRLSVITYDQDFNLSLVKTLSSPGDAPCWASTNKAGTRLYVSETKSGSVTVYDITDANNPVQLQHLFLSGTMPLPTHSHLDATEKFLYVLDRQGVLHILDVATDGTLAESREPFNLGLPAGTVPLGVRVVAK
jgi:DNA-binding beta-propeller fold protein YncE